MLTPTKLTEQIVLEQLICTSETGVFFFNSDTSKLELDFLLQEGSSLVPLEVNAEENLRSKFLRQFHVDYPNSKLVHVELQRARLDDKHPAFRRIQSIISLHNQHTRTINKQSQ